MQEVAIVGGGPAGARCGERLAQAGFRVTIFDEKLIWEKPCGGGLTHKAIERYPFLLDSPQPKKLVRRVELIAGDSQRVTFTLDRPIVIYSRAVLNGLLLDRAERAGCSVVRERVTAVATTGIRPILRVHNSAPGHTYSADFVVLAAGARNALLPETTPLTPGDLQQTIGYFVPVEDDVLKVRFLPRFEGYLWSFPRPDHLSVGICGKISQNTAPDLRTHLEEFAAREGIPTAGARFFSHVLPSPQPSTLRARRVLGRNWALIGDAAAWVDPVTGEGLYYAIRSGDLLAQALIEGRPRDYPACVRAEFSADLEKAAPVGQRLYRGTFLGDAVTVRMVQLARRSAIFRQLLCDLFSGAQNYGSLKRRLWSQLVPVLTEIGRSLLRREGTAQPEEG